MKSEIYSFNLNKMNIAIKILSIKHQLFFKMSCEILVYIISNNNKKPLYGSEMVSFFMFN
jgi:hypothetical protein